MDPGVRPPERLPHAELLILMSLSDGPKHGYALMVDIQDSYGERLGPGTLYAALSRLEAQGLVTPVASESRRRPYRLTEAGVNRLRDHLARLERFAAAGLKRLATL